MQDLSVGAGQLVVLDVGRQVPQETVIGTTVTTDGGEVVSGGMLVFPRHGGGTTEALTTGTATSASRWLFGPAPGGPGVREVFAALDPGTAAASVQLRLGYGAGSAALQATVPPGGVIQIEPPVAASDSMSWASVTSLHGQPIVVARETIVLPDAARAAPVATAAAGQRSSPVSKVAAGPEESSYTASLAAATASTTLPTTATATTATATTATATTATATTGTATATTGTATATTTTTTTEGRRAAGGSVTAPLLAAGASVVLGVPAAASEWVLPGGEADASVGELLVFADPGSEPAVVTLQPLGPRTVLPLTRLHLAPGGEVTWNAGSLTDRGEKLAVVATASCRVLAGSFLYARGAAGGLASVAGIPVS
jgi:hypothetical protein